MGLYTDTILVKKLLENNHKVISFDTQWFGNHLKKHKNLKIIKDDIRNIKKYSLKGIDKFIHLANIANDPSVDLAPSLSWEVNVLAIKEILVYASESNKAFYLCKLWERIRC